jgi:hypothetical protein
LELSAWIPKIVEEKEKSCQSSRAAQVQSSSPFDRRTKPHRTLPEQESFTDQLFRKGLSKKKLRKIGVVSLREKVEQKITDRQDHSGFNVRNKARQFDGFRRFCSNLVQEKSYSQEKLLHLGRLARFPDFQEFLQSEPSWVPRLEQWILSASRRISWEKKKQEQLVSANRDHSEISLS